MHKTVVINVVGLTPALLGPSMPRLSAWAGDGAVARIASAFPAVTCTAQADYLTGRLPRHTRHRRQRLVRARGRGGHVLAAIQRLVQAPKIWDAARAVDPSFTCANLFWWFNMYSTADYSVTPRPMYPADGRKMPDVYTTPPELRDELQSASSARFRCSSSGDRGPSIRSTQWIADAAKRVEQQVQPDADARSICRTSTTTCSGSGRRSGRDRRPAAIDEVCGD